MRKKRNYFTIMIVPHTEEATYSIRLPFLVGQLLVGAFVLVLSVLLILAYAYRNALDEAREVRILRQAVQAQQDEINSFAYETQKILDWMDQIEGLAEFVANKLETVGIRMEKEKDEEADDSSREPQAATERYYASRSGGRVLERTADNISVLQNLMPEQTDFLEALKEDVEEYLRRLAATPSIWPAHGYFTSGFGMRRSPFNWNVMEFHYGIDIAGPHGSYIYTSADGRVAFAGYRGGYGYLVIINHGYGFETYYAHLAAVAVSVGQKVSRGQVVGYMGRTGNVTGTHLHYEVHVNGVPVNPLSYIR
jgi:murein DD-endopeptidase MepM/ murein hydrolase activator NlpD